MQMIHERCAGLDAHKKTVVAGVLITQPEGGVQKHTATFGTMTPDLLALGDGLKSHGITHGARESTGVYGRPIYQLLEGQFPLLVANAQHIKRMPGRKTDVTDAEWLADLARHGLIAPSFVPAQPQRELRELTRHRSNAAGRRTQGINELHRTLEGTNLKLSSVATDLTGVSATDRLQHLLAGQTDPVALADLARGTLRKKIPQLQKALHGTVRAHQQLILSQLLADLAACDEQIEALTTEITGRLQAEQEILERLDAIPGVNRKGAEVVVAELGTDMKRFGRARRAAAWSGMCPGNRESGGRRDRARSRLGNKPLKSALVEAGRAAGRSKDTYLGAQYRRLAARKGGKRAAPGGRAFHPDDQLSSDGSGHAVCGIGRGLLRPAQSRARQGPAGGEVGETGLQGESGTSRLTEMMAMLTERPPPSTASEEFHFRGNRGKQKGANLSHPSSRHREAPWERMLQAAPFGVRLGWSLL